MQARRICSFTLAGLLALALASCSASDIQVQLGQPTSAAPPAQPTLALPASPTAASVEVVPVTMEAATPVESAPAQVSTPVAPAAQQGLDPEEQVVANVYDQVAPAVVRITTGQGLGSGYLIDMDGHIITNNH